jgi:hypothetical protein
MGKIKDMFFKSSQKMPVYHGWNALAQKYKNVGNSIELSIGILANKGEEARKYASNVPNANAAVIEEKPFRNEYERAISKYKFRVYLIKIG